MTLTIAPSGPVAPTLAELHPGMTVFTSDGCRWIVDQRTADSVSLIGGGDWRVVRVPALHTIVDYDTAPIR